MRYPNADWVPGPAQKVNGGTNTVKGVVCHSMVGPYAAALGELYKPTRRASWHYSVLKDGRVMCHYEDEAQTWHAGSAYNNDTIGIEHEGGLKPHDEPLRPAQRDASVALVRWLSQTHGFAMQRKSGLWEHNEVSGEPTACPSNRIPWAYYTEEEDEMWVRHVEAASTPFWNPVPVFAVNFSATIQLGIDLPRLPADASAIDFEIFTDGQGELWVWDGDGQYAGRLTPQKRQAVIRARPLNRTIKLTTKGAAVAVHLFGTVGYLKG